MWLRRRARSVSSQQNLATEQLLCEGRSVSTKDG
jgi:hypothetical protein